MTITTTYPTEEMIEAGAKAAYARLFCDPESWPDINCSMDAKHFRYAAEACFLAMMEIGHPDEEWKNVRY